MPASPAKPEIGGLRIQDGADSPDDNLSPIHAGHALIAPRGITHPPLAPNMLSRNSMKTVFLEVVVGLLAIAACNVAYIAILRLIHDHREKLDRPKLSRAQTPRHVTLHAIDLK
jgi:hypothetical protein